MVWDGRYLPGLWLVERALGVAFERVATHGVVSVAIRRSHHIACLAALVRLATERGYVALLATSDPAFGFVAPYGGREPLLTPNPFAIGYPGSRTPVLVDMCASITTVSMASQKAAAGEAFEHPWLMDAEGRPSTDPRVLEQTDPRGSLLLLGGLEYGHKGFGLALMVEVPVRMPGEQAERRIAAAREHGVPLAEPTVRRLALSAARFGLDVPAAL